MANAQKLSPIQMELLKVYSFSPTENELRDIRSMLARYFGVRLAQKTSEAADRKGITESDLEKWLRDGDS
jgi:hypothetical protein